jgi:hypothetical protein
LLYWLRHAVRRKSSAYFRISLLVLKSGQDQTPFEATKEATTEINKVLRAGRRPRAETPHMRRANRFQLVEPTHFACVVLIFE